MHNSPSINSHFNNLIHMIGNLPQGHEKPLKHALYNAVALLLLSICCAVGYALFLVLEPFFKPLLWALLVGSLLHPIKYSISKSMKKWCNNLEAAERPLVIGLMVLPFDTVNGISKIIGAAIHKYYKVVGSAIILTLGFIWMYQFFPWTCFYILWQLALYANSIISTMLIVFNTYTFITLTVGYISFVYMFWRPETESFFKKTSFLMWIFVSCYIAHLTGSFKALTFVLLQILALAGFFVEVFELKNKMKSKGCDLSISNALVLTLTNKYNSFEFAESSEEAVELNPIEPTSINCDNITKPPGIRDIYSDTPESYPIKARLAFANRTLSSVPLTTPETRSAIESHIVAALQRRALSSDSKFNFKVEPLFSPDRETDSTVYFKCLLWACGAMVLWKHPWIWPLLLIILAIFIIKTIGMFFGVWAFLETHINDAIACIKKWGTTRYTAMMPAHVVGMLKLIGKLNTNLYLAAKESIDSVSSIIVIFGLILFIICAPIFTGVQIYSEGITVIQLTSSLINRTVVHNPELRQLLPPGWDDTVDSLLDNAYLYGREGLSKTVKSILQDTDAEKSAKLEKQLLELWDKVYQTWMTDSGSTLGTQNNVAGIQKSWETFIEDITKTPEMFNTNALIDFAKQNVGTLIALLDSLWSLLKGNVTLLLGSLSAITSVVLGGSTAVLNFMLSLVVFFTTLFYLLNSSSSLYKPIEIISSFSPTNGSRFGLALTDAVNGVFKATLKMAIFYGLWTWLIHNLFGAKIVYLPSALAAIMAAVPFLGTYLACIPAVLDLWLAQGSPVLAILLAICQFAPASYVDTIIYMEIKNGGHPYFTGLAIAGGIFCLGPEGAIFGPLLLCCLLVALNLSTTLFRETPLEEMSANACLHNRLG